MIFYGYICISVEATLHTSLRFPDILHTDSLVLSFGELCQTLDDGCTQSVLADVTGNQQ